MLNNIVKHVLCNMEYNMKQYHKVFIFALACFITLGVFSAITFSVKKATAPKLDPIIVEKIKTIDHDLEKTNVVESDTQIQGVTYFVIGDKSEGFKSITYFETENAQCYIARGGGLSCKFN